MNYTDTVLATNPVHWWRLGESAGASSLVDAAGGLNVPIRNAPTCGVVGVVASDADTACRFEVSNWAQPNSHVDVGVNIGGPLSISIWIQSPATNGYQGRWLFGMRSNAVGGNNSETGIGCYGNKLTLFDRGYDHNTDISMPGLLDGQWHHVVVVLPGPTDDWLVYYDGQYVAGWAGYRNGVSGTMQTVAFCTRPDVGYNYQSASATLDETLLYNRAITAAEVQTIYDATLAAPAPGGSLLLRRRRAMIGGVA